MRILIVEDDVALANGLAKMLRAEGFTAESFRNGESALQALKQEPFDLVLLDVGLPGIDGFEVLRRMRATGNRIPVLLLTARDQIDERVHGLELGADDYLPKPFAMRELIARVRALLRRAKAHAGPRIKHGPLTVDLEARRAFLHGEPLELAAREWSVLQVLLSRPERIVSKEAIIQSVVPWGEDLSPNAIEVYVSRLRAKLEPAAVRIRTVRGFGYLLEEYRGP